MAEEQNIPTDPLFPNQKKGGIGRIFGRLKNFLTRNVSRVRFRKPKYLRDKTTALFLDVNSLNKHYNPWRQGLDDGRKNYPPVDIQGETVFESNVKAHCDDALKRLSRQTQHRLIELNNEQNALDIGPVFAHDIDRVLVEATQQFQILKNESLDNLRRLRREELEHERDYRHFKLVNGLHRKAKLAKPALLTVGILILMIMVEGSVNGVILQELFNGGYIGGFSIAALIGAMNVIFCFLFGKLCLKNTVHVSKARRVWSYFFILLVLPLLAFFHYGLGRLRAFIDTYPVTDTGTQAVSVGDIFSKPVDWSPWSVILIAMGIFFSGIAMLDGFLWSDDIYPGFSAITKSKDKSVVTYVAARKKLSVDANALINTSKQKIDQIVKTAEYTLLKYTGILHEVGAHLRLFNESATQMETACDRIIKTYREANMHVRTQIEPAYFHDSYAKLDRDIGTDIEDASGRLSVLNRLVDDLKVQAEKAKNFLHSTHEGQLKDLDEAIAAIDATSLPLVESNPSAGEHAAGLNL